MARPRTPTKILELRGAFKKDPQRKRLYEPKPIGDIGIHTLGTTDPKEIWNEIVASCPPDVLTNSDRLALEIAVNLMAEFRKDPAYFPNEKLRIIISLLSKFGMTPSDRAKLNIPETNRVNDDDPWAKLARNLEK